MPDRCTVNSRKPQSSAKMCKSALKRPGLPMCTSHSRSSVAPGAISKGAESFGPKLQLTPQQVPKPTMRTARGERLTSRTTPTRSLPATVGSGNRSVRGSTESPGCGDGVNASNVASPKAATQASRQQYFAERTIGSSSDSAAAAVIAEHEKEYTEYSGSDQGPDVKRLAARLPYYSFRLR